MANKEADEAYERAKKLFFKENPDLPGAIKEMQESLRLDDRGNGDRQYQLAKLCLMAYKEEGKGENATFAILAYQYFGAARGKGKHIKEKYLIPIQDIARVNYMAAVEVYRKKEDHTYLAQAAAYLKHSLTLGGLPDGDVEYDLARLYYIWGKKEKAYEYFQKALGRGCKKLTTADETFVADFDQGDQGMSRKSNIDNPDEVQAQLKIAKGMLQTESDKLAQLRAKMDIKISSDVYDKALAEVLKRMGSSTAVGEELDAAEHRYKEATQTSGSLECHIEALKAAGVSPKALLETVGQYVDFSTGANQLFWIRKLGDIQKPVTKNASVADH